MINSMSHRDPLRNSSDHMLARARELRRNMTPAEKRFWKLVRRNW
jgi:very-short-patch-repair endonuclease